jgi:Uma2 family endonuclease
MALMTTRSDATSLLPRGRPFTRADLDRMPDDGNRYELIDGLLIVSPAPRPLHQRAVARLYLLLHEACPADHEVLFAPLDVALADDTVLQPDLLLAKVSDFSDRDLPTAPLLAVEVLSPSTRGRDLLLKKERLERAGCRHYWVMDPLAPSITAWTLVDGAYREDGTATGDEALQVSEPVGITVVPSQLV